MFEPIRKCQNARRFKITAEGKYIPTDADDPDGQEMTLTDVPEKKLEVPQVTMNDFLQSL